MGSQGPPCGQPADYSGGRCRSASVLPRKFQKLSAHSRASGNPWAKNWVPAFAGTSGRESLELDAQEVRDLSDDAAAEQEHAGDEDDALDHGHPLVERVEIVLHRDDHEG